MRIYDLAKLIGQRFNIEVKSAKLAEEFKTLPQFAAIRDQIKSHASTVEESYANLMIDIYAARVGSTAPSATAVAPEAPPQPPPAQPAKAVPPRPTPQAKPAPPHPTPPPKAEPVRPATPRPTAVPRPAPIRPPQPTGGVPAPALHRPAPIPPVGRGGTPVAPPPPPPAKTDAPLPPAASAASPPAAAPPVKPVAPKPAQPKPRPTGLATQLKSSSGTTGVTATPDAGRPAADVRPGARAAGQPAAPPPPKFSAGSPFVQPPPRKPPAESPERKPALGPARATPAALSITPEQLPQIGVMKIKGKRRTTTVEKPGKRGREGEGEAEEAPKGAKRKLRPSKVYGDADEFRRPTKILLKRPKPAAPVERRAPAAPPKPAGPIVLTGPVTVGEFAQKIGVSPAEIIKRALAKGHMLSINRQIEFDLAEEIAFELDIDVQVRLEGDETDIEALRVPDDPARLKPRPPVVTIMGHVDHGKTTILDYYRRSRIAEGEYGGITQAIGAYLVHTPRGDIVFLDTPGHEAFTAMRARGVMCTDIVVLVVGADDGVMPQTVEAIHHAQAAGVPIIVAINKIDLPQARPDRVRNDLLQYNLVGTAMGGDTEFVEISAKQGIGMDNLLEIICLQAELMELKADPDRPAEGVVIESHVDPLRGSVATVLVRKGTLRVGQCVLAGCQYGRVRAMFDDLGKPVQAAGPSHPVEVIGLSGTPEVGELLLVLENEQLAREIAERRAYRRRIKELGTARPVSMAGLSELIAEGKVKELNIILKADVQGSIEAIREALEKKSTDQTRVRIIHSGTGAVNESDVTLAMASQALIIGFNVRPDAAAEALAAREGVEIKLYRIIYELLEDVDKTLAGLLEKRFREVTQGRSEVRQVFRISKVGTVAGCMVVMGEIQRNARCRLVRDGKVVYDGHIASLRRVKDDVAKVPQGYECGIALENFQDIKQGDIIETYTMEEIPQELTRTAG